MGAGVGWGSPLVQGCVRPSRGQAGGAKGRPHELPLGWWGQGPQSCLPRGHSVLYCTVPALFVFLPRGWGWAGLTELGALGQRELGEGGGEWSGGGAGVPPPRQLSSVTLLSRARVAGFLPP